MTVISEKFVYDAKGRAHGVKDPNAQLDYTFDFTSWLGTDTIATAVPAVEVGTATITASATNGKVVTVWLSGGVLGEVLQLRCRITTVNVPPRIDDRTMFLRVRSR